jgi:hypothetical protein
MRKGSGNSALESGGLRRGGVRWLAGALAATVGACSGLLPHDESRTYSPWKSYEEAQQAFDTIVPHETTVHDLVTLGLDPKANPNVAILNYSDVLRRFLPSPSVNAADLDVGVQECIAAKTHCRGYEVNQQVTKSKRYGSFLLDWFNFQRKTDVAGWRFNGVLLIKDDVIIYKLTGGEPAIHSFQQSTNPLGPLQGFGNAAAQRVLP